MKINYFTSLVCLFIVACTTDDPMQNLPVKDTSLVGKWQLIETYISPGGTTQWNKVDKGFQYYFDDQGSYVKTDFTTLVEQSGNYQIKENDLFLFYKHRQEQDTLGYQIELFDASLVLSPSYPAFCIEGCLYRFERVK